MMFLMNLYLKFVKFTSKIEYVFNKDIDFESCLVSFWHGDTTSMYFLAEDFAKRVETVRVLITEDSRGDVIEGILKKRKVESYRVSYNENFRRSYKELMQLVKTRETVAFSADGPLGPYHIPKKFLFDLANRSNRELFQVEISYSRVKTLKKRWDFYKIPLPFSKITYNLIHLGTISKEFIDEFKQDETIYEELLKKNRLEK